jgi:multimeric flavodoxin WrbA/putative sterol carrier protein
MKVLALNSSPRGEGQSKTEMILNPMVEGMRQAGAQVEVVNLRQKTVRNCIGCYTCWTKTPGVCIHKDDMTLELFPKWLEADMAVYATPLYHFTMTASMKAFIERTLPVLEPFLIQVKDRTTHPIRHKMPKVVVMSVAGFPEMTVFDQLSSYVRFLFGRGLLAEIYRPGAEGLARMPSGGKREGIFDSLRVAGVELVRSQKVTDETLARITQPLGAGSVSAELGNLMWKTCIAEKITPKEMQERGIVPRPDSIETFLMILSMGFHPEKVEDLKAVIQFEFSGETGGPCHVLIQDGRIQATAGPAERPDLTIETPFEVWMDIMTGKRDGQEAFMAQAYRIKGDPSLLMRMGDLFGK